MRHATSLLRRAALAVLSLLALAAAIPAHAQFPTRPIRLVVPYAPGGSTDVLARALAESMRKTLGQPVIVDNKPGGNTAIGALLVTSAPADGHTLLLVTGSTVVTNPLLYAKLAYNPRELTPVARVAIAPLVVEVTASVPARSFGEFVQLARSQPGRFNYASTGPGSVIHLASLLLESQAGLSMTHVPFNGSAPAIAATVSGEVHLFLDSIGSSLPMIKSGRLRALAVTTPERLKVLPDVPSVAESLPGFDASAWYGIMAPAKTPPDVIAKLNAAAAAAISDKAFQDQFEALGMIIPPPTSAAAFGEQIRRETDRWGPLIRQHKLALE